MEGLGIEEEAPGTVDPSEGKGEGNN